MSPSLNRSTFIGLAVVAAVSMTINLLMLASPLFMLQVYDRVLASRSLPTLTVLVLLVSATYGFYGLLEWLRARMVSRFASLVDHWVGEPLFRAAIRLRLVPNGMNTDPVRDADTLRTFLGGPGPLALLDLPWVPVYLAVLFLIHPLLGWLATGGGLLIAGFMVANEFALRRPARDTNTAATARRQQLDDATGSAEPVLAMAMEDDLGRRWRHRTSVLLTAQRSSGDRASFFSALSKSVRFLLQSLVLALGAFLVIQGQMTGGLMIAASVMTSRALAPVEQTIAQWKGFLAARQALTRIRKHLAVTSSGGRATLLPQPSRNVVVRQASSGPPGTGRALLSGVQFELAAGEGLGVLGSSGAGKTSLARMILGVWPTLTGEVRLDGALLSHYDATQARQFVGYLPQRVDLLDGTVAENIARFQPDASDNAVIEAARLADVHELINSLPNGYDTRVGVQGDSLSAGQRQRIGLARALFGNPFLCVLDEPNSNLDAEGDEALAVAIRAVRERGGIVVVVAHRPSAVSAVDKLLFLKNGRQIAFGPKQDVLRQVSGDNVRPIKVGAE